MFLGPRGEHCGLIKNGNFHSIYYYWVCFCFRCEFMQLHEVRKLRFKENWTFLAGSSWLSQLFILIANYLGSWWPILGWLMFSFLLYCSSATLRVSCKYGKGYVNYYEYATKEKKTYIMGKSILKTAKIHITVLSYIINYCFSRVETSLSSFFFWLFKVSLLVAAPINGFFICYFIYTMKEAYFGHQVPIITSC